MVEALDASPSKRSPTSWKWYGCGLLALLFLLVSEGVELFSVKRATRAPSKRIAFVVLTDPRENHEENVIPMLAHVESKYGGYRAVRVYAGPRGMVKLIHVLLALAPQDGQGIRTTSLSTRSCLPKLS